MRSVPVPKVPPPKPAKYKDSCDNCALSKVKCNRAKPECQRCVRNGITCHYSLARRGKARLLFPESPSREAKQSSSAASLITPPSPSSPGHNEQRAVVSSSDAMFGHDPLSFITDDFDLPPNFGATHSVMTSAACDDVGMHMSTLAGQTTTSTGSITGRLAWCDPDFGAYPDPQSLLHEDPAAHTTRDSQQHASTLSIDWSTFHLPADMPGSSSSVPLASPLVDPLLTPTSMANTLFSSASLASHSLAAGMTLDQPEQVCHSYRNCMRLALSTYESLQTPGTAACALEPALGHRSGKGGSVSSARAQSMDVIFKTSRAAIENVCSILQCPCSEGAAESSTSSKTILLVLICSSVMDAYQRISLLQENLGPSADVEEAEFEESQSRRGRKSASVTTPQSSTSEVESMDLDVPIAIGGYMLDGQAKRKVISSVLLSELYKVGQVIEKVTSRAGSQCQSKSSHRSQQGGDGSRKGSSGEMVSMLKSSILARLRATIASIKAEAEF